MPKILVVEDEPNLRKLLEVIIAKEGYDVATVENGEQALQAISRSVPDLVLTDLVMDQVDGLELCRRIRQIPHCEPVPIMILTAKGEPLDKYQGFREGADDYLTKPFDPVELIFRIQAHLRRSGHKPGESRNTLEVAGLTLDRNNYQVRSGERSSQLTKSEFAILAYMMERADQVIASELLLVEALSYPPGVGNSEIIRTHIRNIRQKMEQDPGNPRVLITVGRHGYSIRRSA